MSRPGKFENLPSEVTILKTNAAAKKGPGAYGQSDTETVWPKPEFVSVIASRLEQRMMDGWLCRWQKLHRLSSVGLARKFEVTHPG
jgi:hypothetical protein